MLTEDMTRPFKVQSGKKKKLEVRKKEKKKCKIYQDSFFEKS